MAIKSIIALAGQTAGTLNSADQTCPFPNRGVKVVMDLTAVGTLSLVCKIQGKDPLSGKYFDILTSVAITGAGTVVFTVWPGITPIANLAVADIMPRAWRFQMAIAGGAPNVTGTVYPQAL